MKIFMTIIFTLVILMGLWATVSYIQELEKKIDLIGDKVEDHDKLYKSWKLRI